MITRLPVPHTFRQPLRSPDTFPVQATHGYAAWLFGEWPITR
jgi:hypothetical protein